MLSAWLIYVSIELEWMDFGQTVDGGNEYIWKEVTKIRKFIIGIYNLIEKKNMA